MKPLPEEFKKKGFSHRLERRCKNVAIYKRWKNVETPHWEVVLIRVAPASKFTVDEVKNGQIRERTIERPESEVYPSSEQWGSMGFTYPDESSALTKFNSLLK